MFKNIFVAALKNKKSIFGNDERKMAKAMDKIKKQKRLSSQEFLTVYNSLWKTGPTVQYQNPDGQISHFQSKNENHNLNL